jgi:threonine synthase
MVYYFKGFFALQAQGVSLENGMDVCVPSGNFGNIYAAYLASRMGLPIRRLVVATNENDVLDEFFKTGLYRPRSREQTIATSSPSMDISKASNFERYIYDWVGAERTQDLWRQLQQKGFFELKDKLPQIQKMMISGRSTHQDRLKTIRAVYEENRYILDPHTADGVFIAHSVVKDSTPILVVETALAVKFNSTIKEALGFDMAYPTHLRDLEQRPQRVKSLALDLLQLKSFLAGSIG